MSYTEASTSVLQASKLSICCRTPSSDSVRLLFQCFHPLQKVLKESVRIPQHDVDASELEGPSGF